VEFLKKKVVKRPFTFGGIVHELIEEYANNRDPFKKLDAIQAEKGKMFEAEFELYGDIIEDVRSIMTEYFEYWGDDSLMYLRRGNRYAEHEFNIEIADGIIFNGKIDAIAKTPNKLLWIVEHKTFKRMPENDERWRNIQSAVYLKALQITGLGEADGMCWDYIHSGSPEVPKILKSGKLSEAKLNTLPSVIRRYAEEQGYDPNFSKKLIDAAQQNIPNYFMRVFTPINQNIVESVYKDFIDSAQELIENHGKKKVKNIGMHCKWCDYEPICRAELTGSDVDMIIKGQYKIEKRETKDENPK
jgi:hypothetical protein